MGILSEIVKSKNWFLCNKDKIFIRKRQMIRAYL